MVSIPMRKVDVISVMEFNIYLLFLFEILCCLNTVSAQRTPVIAYISEDQIRDVGDQVDFVCTVHHARDYPVVWLKYDRSRTDSIVLSDKAGLIDKHSRFSLKHDDTTSTFTLSIEDIEEEDDGWYLCQVQMSMGNTLTAEVGLQLRRSPKILKNSTTSVVASEKKSVQMECYADGYPLPNVSWRRENKATLPTGDTIYRGNILTIESVRKEDRGTYYCVAKNGIGRGVNRKINLQVEFPPVVTVTRPRLWQALGYNASLGCHLEAYPRPSVFWVKDDVEISNNEHYNLYHFATEDDISSASVRVITIEKQQFGTYSCVAQNKLGSAQGHVELIESMVPSST